VAWNSTRHKKIDQSLAAALSMITATAILSLSSLAYSQLSNTETATYYISADAASGGDGSQNQPFASLTEAEQISKPGDTLYLLRSSEDKPIDGGIALKPGQKLMGVDDNGQLLEEDNDRVNLTNSSSYLGGVIVQLSDNNEIAGIHFQNMANAAVSSGNADFSGTHIHHTSYSGNAQQHIEDERGLVYAVSFDTTVGELNDITVEHSNFRSGEDLGGIRVFHWGNSKGNYHFENNHFTDLGGRAYFVRTSGSSKVETVILDSSADNIGRGNRNSDSIIPYLMGQSEQIMVVNNYHYKNTNQEGDQSNTGIEAFIFGSPRPDEANWCDGCRLTFKILNSVIENAVTDPIQFSNSGINSDLSYEIRNTRIIGGNPRQGGGGISLNMQTVPQSGTRTSLLIENNDIIGTSGYGFSFNNRAGGDEGFEAIIDLGGGALGSQGNNRFIENARGDIRIPSPAFRITAKNNWWDASVTVFDPDHEPLQNSKVEFEPTLQRDPR
jgi:hypothetical protein